MWNSISDSKNSRKTTFTHLELDFQIKRKHKPLPTEAGGRRGVNGEAVISGGEADNGGGEN